MGTNVRQRYLMKQRLPVGDEEPWPNEPLEDYRAHYRTILKPHHKEYALRQFLDLDGKVLRFFCVWDDRAVPYGERRPYVCCALPFLLIIFPKIICFSKTL